MRGMVKRKNKGKPVWVLKDYRFSFFFVIEIQIEIYCFRSLFSWFKVNESMSFLSLHFTSNFNSIGTFNQRRKCKAIEWTKKKNEIKRSESCSIHLGPLKEDSTQIQYHIFHCLLLLNTLRIVKRIIFDKRSNEIRKRGRENETNEKKAIDLLLFRTFYNYIRRRRTNYKEALFNFPKRGF